MIRHFFLFGACFLRHVSSAEQWVPPYSFGTTLDRQRNMSALSAPVFGKAAEPDWVIDVNDDKSSGFKQIIDGFGAAWTDAAVACLDSLPSELQRQAISSLFGDDGIGLKLMRHTVGQSDLTPAYIGEWSYDSNNG